MTSDVSPHHLPVLGVVVVAAGSGERLGAGRPKAFVELGGRTLLEHVVSTVLSIGRPGQLVLVVPESRAGEALEIAEGLVPAGSGWQVSVVGGGRERHESVRKGLDALQDGIETVLVHDAARPLTPAAVFERVADEVARTRNGVIPVLPVVDTLKRVDLSGTVRSTADRRILVAVQTPQGFPRDTLVAAHQTAQAREESASPANDAPTDDAEVVQRFGGVVHTIPGDPRSHKLTNPEDLLMLHGLLDPLPADRFDAATAPPAEPESARGAAEPETDPEPETDAELDGEPGGHAETEPTAAMSAIDSASQPVEPPSPEAVRDDAEETLTAIVLPPAPDPVRDDTLDTFDRLLRGEADRDGA